MLTELVGPAPAAPLRLALDEQALSDNWRALDRLSGQAAAGAAIKADAYGTGARRAARVLRIAGAQDFFVAHWCEAEEVLDLVDPAGLSVLHGPLTDEDVRWGIAAGVRPVINSPAQAARWLEAGGGRCDLMVDTGINRLGIRLEDLGNETIGRLQVDVLMSHLASAEEDTPQNELQRLRWEQARRLVPHRRASLANSAGIVLGEAFHGALTRPGLSLYGGIPCSALAPHIRPVVTPQAAILQVRSIAAGETVGYNADFTAPTAMRVGVIALGYADGYLRCWSGRGAALSQGRRLPVLGRVSMDMTVIDLGEAPDVGEGDWVDLAYDLPQAARATGLSQYELLTSFGARFSR